MMKAIQTIRILACLLLALPSAAAYGQLSVPHPEIDMGTVSEDDAPVEHTFVCRNDGTEPVTVVRVKTTCGCTGAEVARPHLLPGEETEVRVTYNPLGHPGQVLTYINLFTDGGDDKPAATCRLVGRVTPSAALWQEYRYAMGDLRLRRKQVKFDRPQAGQRRVERIVCANAGTRPLRLKAAPATLPPWLTLRTVPGELPAGEEGAIELVADGSELPPADGHPLRAKVLLEGLDVRPTDRMIEITITD